MVGGESAVCRYECVWFSAPAWAPFAVGVAVAGDCGFASCSVLWFVDLGGCCCAVVFVAFCLVLRAPCGWLDAGAARLGADAHSLAWHVVALEPRRPGYAFE